MNSKTAYWYMAKNGKEIRELLLKDAQDDNALIGVSYKMLNAIKQGDNCEFMDIVMRLCNSVKRPMPSELINILDKSQFREYAQAFVLGLRGGFYEKGETTNE